MLRHAREESFERASLPARQERWSHGNIQAERKELRRRALQMLGGKCCKCGYSGVALDFHHKDPATKKFSISEAIFTLRPWREIKAEVVKCVLFCANHHREFHSTGG